MESLENKTLGFFMNYRSSLEVWDTFGMLQREILLYNKLATHFKKIYIFTYGGKKEREFQKYLKENIELIPKKYALPDVLYEFLFPFIYMKLMKECDLYKTNQNSGAIAPSIASLILRKKFIVRSGYIGSELARQSRLPWWAKFYFWLAENISYRVCDQAFIPSKENYDILIQKYPFLKKKLVMMNNFIDTNLFKKTKQGKKYDIIYVARFDKDKNHVALLSAVKDLNLEILFIGQGKEKENIISFSQKNNIHLESIDKIPNNEIPTYYNSSTMCVFPSLHEGNPKVLLEAMSCELPVIALDVPGIGSIIKNEKNGLISDANPQKIKKAIVRILNDKKLQEKIGRAGREFVVQNYSLDTLFDKELSIYQTL